MLKKTITYEDFNGNLVKEDFYFNLSKAEILTLEFDYEKDGGFEKLVKKILNEKDNLRLINLMQELILKTYGVKSEDGKRFIKGAEMLEAFEQSAAYDALFFELGTNAESAAEFINGIIPSNLAKEVENLKQNGVTPGDIQEIPVVEEDTRPAWIREDRDPTKEELSQMSTSEMAEAMKRRITRNN